MNDEEIKKVISETGEVQQFINSLKFISGGTGMATDKMEKALVRLCMLMFKMGEAISKEVTNDKGGS